MKRYGHGWAGVLTAAVLGAANLGIARGAAAAEARVGEAAPPISLRDVATGETRSLADYRGEKIVVVTFQSVDCPWNRMRPGAGYERVLAPMAQKYAGRGVQFLAINSNDSESVETIKAYQAEHSLPYPILKDPGHRVADAYGAKTTPHFFVIDRQGVLRYMGGFEQSPPNPDKCGEMDKAYLAPVLDALLAGEEPPVTQTKSIGCAIER